MKGKKLLAYFIFIVLLVNTIPIFIGNEPLIRYTSATWWNSDWQYNKILSLSSFSGFYPLRIVVNYSSGAINCSGHCQPDFDDVRFVDIDNTTVLPYWKERYVASNYAVFWVNVSADAFSDGKIVMYYGNTTATDNSNGSATFYFFDDYSTNTTSNYDHYHESRRETYMLGNFGEDNISIMGKYKILNFDGDNNLGVNLGFAELPAPQDYASNQRRTVAIVADADTPFDGEQWLLGYVMQNYNDSVNNYKVRGNKTLVNNTWEILEGIYLYNKTILKIYDSSMNVLVNKNLTDGLDVMPSLPHQAFFIYHGSESGSYYKFEWDSTNKTLHVLTHRGGAYTELDTQWDWIIVRKKVHDEPSITSVSGENTIPPSNYAPTITNEFPTNRSYFIQLQPQLSVTINDTDGDSVDYWLWTSTDGITWSLALSGTESDGNTTLTYTFSNANQKGEKYYWKISANDGIINTTKTFWFVTNITYSNPSTYGLNLTQLEANWALEGRTNSNGSAWGGRRTPIVYDENNNCIYVFYFDYSDDSENTSLCCKRLWLSNYTWDSKFQFDNSVYVVGEGWNGNRLYENHISVSVMLDKYNYIWIIYGGHARVAYPITSVRSAYPITSPSFNYKSSSSWNSPVTVETFGDSAYHEPHVGWNNTYMFLLRRGGLSSNQDKTTMALYYSFDNGSTWSYKNITSAGNDFYGDYRWCYCNGEDMLFITPTSAKSSTYSEFYNKGLSFFWTTFNKTLQGYAYASNQTLSDTPAYTLPLNYTVLHSQDKLGTDYGISTPLYDSDTNTIYILSTNGTYTSSDFERYCMAFLLYKTLGSSSSWTKVVLNNSIDFGVHRDFHKYFGWFVSTGWINESGNVYAVYGMTKTPTNPSTWSWKKLSDAYIEWNHSGLDYLYHAWDWLDTQLCGKNIVIDGAFWKHLIKVANGDALAQNGRTQHWVFISVIPPTGEEVKSWYTLEEWTSSSLFNSSSWKDIETWTGTVNNYANWNPIEEWSGSLSNQSYWNTIEEWTSNNIYNSSSWYSIEVWTGSLSNTSKWRKVEEWSGELNNQSSWRVVAEWNGKLYNSSNWYTIEEISGQFSNFSKWKNISSLTGNLINISSWKDIESFSGELTNTSSWKDIETFTGELINLSSWYTIESWNGNIINTSSWSIIEIYSGNLINTSSWRSISTYSGSLYNTSSWYSIEEVSGDLLNSSNWHNVETIFGSIVNNSCWNEIESWNGGLNNISLWHTIEEYSGSLYNSSNWHSIEIISGTVYNSTAWSLIESWSGSFYNASSWNTIEEITGSISNFSSWHDVESFAGNLYNSSSWNNIEVISGNLYNSSNWYEIQIWSGYIYNSTGWTTIESWNGNLHNSSFWHSIESFTGSLYNTSNWYLIETWNGSIYSTNISWNTIELWSGTILNSSVWNEIETFNGNIYNSSSWKLIESFTGQVYNSTYWNSIEIWSENIYNITGWTTIELWTGNVLNTSNWHPLENWSGNITTIKFWSAIETWSGELRNISTIATNINFEVTLSKQEYLLGEKVLCVATLSDENGTAITNATISYKIYNESMTLLASSYFTNNLDGTYYFDYEPAELGNYMIYAEVYNLFRVKTFHVSKNYFDILDNINDSIPNASTLKADFEYYILVNTQVQFIDTSVSSSNIINWTWVIDNQTFYEQNPKVSFSGKKTITVNLTVKDDYNRTDSISKNVTVYKKAFTPYQFVLLIILFSILNLILSIYIFRIDVEDEISARKNLIKSVMFSILSTFSWFVSVAISISIGIPYEVIYRGVIITDWHVITSSSIPIFLMGIAVVSTMWLVFLIMQMLRQSVPLSFEKRMFNRMWRRR